MMAEPAGYGPQGITASIVFFEAQAAYQNARRLLAPGLTADWAEKFFSHTSEQGILHYCHLSRCCAVSKSFRDAVNTALRLVRTLAFDGGFDEEEDDEEDRERRCTGEDVLRALGRVSGQNLRVVDLRGCSLISDQHMDLIVACVRVECPGVTEINLEGCSATAILRAVAVRAQQVFGTASPRDLYSSIKKAGDGVRCTFPRLLERLSESPAGAHLTLDPEFEPEDKEGEDEDEDEDEEEEEDEEEPARRRMRGRWRMWAKVIHSGGASVVALLLSVSFGEGKFECHDEDTPATTTPLHKTPLHHAAARGDADLCRVLLDAGADVDKANEEGDTPLLLALRAGSVEVARMLMDAGADVNEVNDEGDTALMLACRAGNVEMATMMRAAGADVNKVNRQGDTALLLSCQAGSVELARMMRAAGADVNKVNDEGDTALLLSCQAGSVELATMCLDAGADVNKANNKGDTPLLSAVAANRLALAQLVVRHARRFHIATLADFTFATMVEAYLSLTNMRDWLHAGVAPRTLALEVGALMTFPGVDADSRKRLDEVRAFLHFHNDRLGDTSAWPVAHFIEQLASQWPGGVFHADASAEPSDEMRLVRCGDQPKTNLRFSLLGYVAIKSVAFSMDGRNFAVAEGADAVVYCAVSYREVCRLSGHR